jgi:hypothetical protein
MEDFANKKNSMKSQKHGKNADFPEIFLAINLKYRDVSLKI